MGHLLPRFRAVTERIDDERRIGKIVLESTPIITAPKATLPGDARRLRGIPVAARGVGGATHRSVPHRLEWS